MTPETFIEKGIEGGWKCKEEECTHKLMADENGMRKWETKLVIIQYGEMSLLN